MLRALLSLLTLALLALLALLTLLTLLALLALLALLTLLALLALLALLTLLALLALLLLLPLLLRRLAHGIGGFLGQRLCFACLRGTRLGPRFLEPLGQRLHFALEIARTVRQRTWILIGRRRAPLTGLPFTRLAFTLRRLAVGLAVQAVGHLLLRLRQILGIIAQRLHGAFERRTLQHLGALLELLAHLLLRFRELLHGLLRLRAAQLVGILVERLELLLHFGGHRIAQHLLDVAHA